MSDSAMVEYVPDPPSRPSAVIKQGDTSVTVQLPDGSSVTIPQMGRETIVTGLCDGKQYLVRRVETVHFTTEEYKR